MTLVTRTLPRVLSGKAAITEAATSNVKVALVKKKKKIAASKTAAREGLFLKGDHSEKSGAKSCPKASAQVVGGGVGGEGGRKVGGEGRNVSRPVEFSAARPLLADKAGRAKSGLQAVSPNPPYKPAARSRAP